MDEKNITYHWKQYKHYWGLVLGKTISSAWVRIGGFFAIVVPTAISIVLSLRDKPFESLGEFGARSDMTPIFAFLFVGCFFVLLLLSLEPVRLNSEQER